MVYQSVACYCKKIIIIQNEHCFDLWNELRILMLYIARENIEKAYFIQSGFSRESNIKESYYGIYWLEVLKMQNEVSDASIHSKPIIWVLSVFITFIAEYMFFGKKEDGSQTGR